MSRGDRIGHPRQVRESGGLFGGGQSSGRTRRGLEKTLFQFTIVLAAVFLLVS